ncbi:nitrogenase component 1 [Clostridium luticellarii]|jgi:nitrogenase molybdenum-iron protein beta chain|uniref:Nitrogenase iron-iron protein beta chain n=1 Tax=Clostridium luticellarii TaxID=1691940 RepID=A0A2T0BPJ1_9CLOT|nr:nitrogenase component 1 [Clostridium luticellarii]MCI1945368.1 oxalate:formate antiporter [Clostridium luticellarii]MCI1996990.1 oxalate:formate antiporter [Clostridium luticellarii]PRR85789.1 Nitrogenase iron-iron protein beta chain [Clostridium luticellarii]
MNINNTSIIEAPRNSCAFSGALQTIENIERAVSIVHSTAGCAAQQYLGVNKVSGNRGAGCTGGIQVPSSNVIEKQVIFGGTSRLREQIKNTIKVIDADLYVILSGCATELVGDDIPAMTKEAQEQRYPVINAQTPGFKGDIHHGYEIAVTTLIQQLPKIYKVSSEKIKGLVNIFGIIPNQDVFWQGNLFELKRILESIGLSANTLFGFGQSVENWKQVSNAELNLVFSPWGIKAAEYLKDKYNIPYLNFNSLPAGFNTASFIREVARQLNINEGVVEKFIETEENKLNYHLKNMTDFYYEYNLQKEFAIVSESSLALGTSEFLSDLGLIPKVVIITDNPEDNYREYLQTELEKLLSLGEANLYFEEDQEKINKIIKKNENELELILGSSMENQIADIINVPIQHISFPIWDDVILEKTYIGYRGAVTLIEDLSTAIRNFNRTIEVI